METSMRHYCVLMNQRVSYKNTSFVNEYPQKVIIRSKGELTKAKVNSWIKRNSGKYVSYEFKEVLGYGFNDRNTMNWF